MSERNDAKFIATLAAAHAAIGALLVELTEESPPAPVAPVPAPASGGGTAKPYYSQAAGMYDGTVTVVFYYTGN